MLFLFSIPESHEDHPPAPPTPACFYTSDFFSLDYDLAQASLKVHLANSREPAKFHNKRYQETLQDLSRFSSLVEADQVISFGLGAEDTPVFSGVYEGFYQKLYL
jgi:hypothetical protein